MQAFEYEKRDNTPGKLEEFFTATKGKILHPFISKVALEIVERRKTFWDEATNAK